MVLRLTIHVIVKNPSSLVIGDGNLLPGFEKALFGLRAGDRRTVHLPPEDAFGPWNPENIQMIRSVIRSGTWMLIPPASGVASQPKQQQWADNCAGTGILS